MIKTRLRNRISNQNLEKLLRIAIEGTDLASVDLTKILDVFKEKNHRILLQIVLYHVKGVIIQYKFCEIRGGGGENTGHFPLYETLLDLCYSSCSTVIG